MTHFVSRNELVFNLVVARLSIFAGRSGPTGSLGVSRITSLSSLWCLLVNIVRVYILTCNITCRKNGL